MEKNYIQNNGKAKGKIYIGLDHGYGNIKTPTEYLQPEWKRMMRNRLSVPTL